MARKPTGRPPGRPINSRPYRSSDDHLCIKMARLIINNLAAGVRDAARQVASEAEGPTGERSKMARLIRNYRRRERWFTFQAITARNTDLPDFAEAAAAIVASQLRFAHLVKEFARQQEDFQRMSETVARLIREPLGKISWTEWGEFL